MPADALQACTSSGAGSLLDHIGGYVNPLRLIRRIPEGMAIARLRDRIVQIVADFRTQTSLREGCNTILHTDCVLLAQVGIAQESHAASWALLPVCMPSSTWACTDTELGDLELQRHALLQHPLDAAEV